MFDKFSLSGLDLYAPLTVPVWAAAAAAALLLLLLLIALFRGGFAAVIGGLVRLGFLVLAAVVAWWIFFTWLPDRDRIEARRALEQRLDELTARVLAPNSALGCLEPGLGDAVDNSCEKALFASPETVGAATALVAARWSLLARAVEHAKQDPQFDARLNGLRRTLQADRYGFLAQVLSTREGCTAARCDGLERLSDPTRVRANLAERTFEGLVARNAVAWANRTHVPTAAVPSPNVTFPSASSIPPVSIMGTEPGAGAPAAAAPTPPRRAAPKAAPRPATARPAPISPPATGTTGAAPDQ
ncbi:MAG TPA: hypothetical protein VGX95_10025 [Xanthobacteraceae bacterium]|jgi:hypothetical protein|nr:hypothetical protein [Xanthobacteraceae bacterium]